jgi:hypothetical protein
MSGKIGTGIFTLFLFIVLVMVTIADGAKYLLLRRRDRRLGDPPRGEVEGSWSFVICRAAKLGGVTRYGETIHIERHS